MSLSMYEACVPALTQALNNLSHILDKGLRSAEARKIGPSVLLDARLAPDMLPLLRQVHIASDTAKGAATRLAGHEVPRYEDTETTFEELQARIQKTLELIRSIPPADFEGAESRSITLKLRGNEMVFSGRAYLFNFVLPNLYFHVTTAYDILRHNGVDLGKPDYLGALPGP